MKPLEIKGKTQEGLLVVDVFPFISSTGVPLELLLDLCKKNRLQPDWAAFIDQAIRSNWSVPTIRSKIENAVGEIYGPLRRDETSKRILLYLNSWIRENS
jgi:hypothetical protein